MKAQDPKRFLHAILATLPPLVAFVLQWLLWPVIHPYAWFLFYPAVFVSSWIGGLRAGLRATVISTVIVWWFFIPPEYSLVKEQAKHFLAAGVFLSMGFLFSTFHGRLRKASRQAAEALTAARSANDELQTANERVSLLYKKTKELDELKTQFFASVSHELRTPLALILGPAERMLASPETTGSSRQDIDVIVRNARTLLRQVNDLLDLSKLDAAAMTMQYADTDLGRLVRLVASHFEVLAKEKNMTYVVEAPANLHAQVDPDKLWRVIVNLLSNAFKFTPAGGCVRLTLREDQGRAVLEVGDSGPGIPLEQCEAVFERFRQLEGGATRRFAGTGLGLAIARDFVAMHHGTISVTDAPEGGSLLVVNMPLQAPPGTVVRTVLTGTLAADEARQVVEELRGRPKVVPATAGTANTLVLVVEDNTEMNRFICESLAAEHRVAAAFGGAEGLKRTLELRPDLILSDVMMPGMSGEEFVRAVRAHRELDRVPIIILTAKADDELRIRLLREGAQDCLTKPFSIEELRARVGVQIARKTAIEALRHSEERLRALYDQASDGIFIADLDGRYTDVNDVGCRMLGYSRDEIIGKTIVDLIPPDDADRLRQAKEQLLQGGIHIAEWALRRKDGAYLPVEVSAKILPDGRWQGFVRDVTERRQAQERLKESESRFRSLLESAGEGIYGLDNAGRCTFVNDAAIAMIGFTRGELIGHDTHSLIHHSYADGSPYPVEACPIYEALRTGESRRGITEMLWRKDGSSFPAEYSAQPLRQEDRVTGAVLVFRDVSEQQALTQRLSYQATHDALTGLANRREFERRVERVLADVRHARGEHALAYLDLDRFKVVNDTCGHSAGDQLLRQIAHRLQERLRARDTLARLGGDEFGVLIEHCPFDQAVRIATDLRDAVREYRFVWEDRPFEIGVSIGLVPITADVQDLAALLSAADTACYAAKAHGRNHVQVGTPWTAVNPDKRSAGM